MRPLPVILSSAALLGLVSLFFAGAVTVAVVEVRRSHRAEAIASKAAATFASDQAKAKQVADQEAAAQVRRTELDRQVAQLRGGGRPGGAAAGGSNGPGAPGARTPRASAEDLSDGNRFVATSPQARNTLLEIGRAQIESQFAPFYRKAGLSPEQIKAFEDATAEHWLQNIAMSPNSIHPTDPALPEGPLRALLGDAGYQQYQDFTKLQPAANVTRQMSMGMSLAGGTMTTAQMDQVTQIIASNSPSYQTGGTVNPGAVDWAAAMKQIETVVTPEQVAALQTTIAQMKTQQALNAAARAAAQAAAAPTTAGP